MEHSPATISAISMIVHAHGNRGVRLSALTRKYNRFFGSKHAVLRDDQMQAVVLRLTCTRELIVHPFSDDYIVRPSPFYLEALRYDGTIISEIRDMEATETVCTYVPDFATGFLIGKGGQFAQQIYDVTGIEIVYCRCQMSLQKAVLTLTRVHYKSRAEAVFCAFRMLQRRIYALYYSYKQRSKPRAICRPSFVKNTAVWSVWNSSPLSVLVRDIAPESRALSLRV